MTSPRLASSGFSEKKGLGGVLNLGGLIKAGLGHSYLRILKNMPQ